MPQVRSITYSYGHTVQYRQYEPIRVDYSETIELEEGEDPEQVRLLARNRVITAVEADLAALRAQAK